MSWPYLPEDFDQQYDSAWVWLPNSLYDSVKGHDLSLEYWVFRCKVQNSGNFGLFAWPCWDTLTRGCRLGNGIVSLARGACGVRSWLPSLSKSIYHST
jgi:hypothetical protein